jgi:hypothetical protein
MNDILAMHDPYPAYNPPSATPEGLAPLVDIASYPICAGQFTMHPDYSVTLQNGEGGDEQQDNSVPLRLALENFRNADQEEAKRQIAKNIRYAVISDIQDCDNFTYSCHRVNRTTEGYSLDFVCSSDLATQPSETNRRNKRRAGAIPRHGKFRFRVDCRGMVSIVVTTEAVTVDYKHRPIHKKAPNRRVDNQLKDIIRNNNFASARELRRYIQHDLRDPMLRNYTSAQLYYWWARFNRNMYLRDPDEFTSMRLLLEDRADDGFNILPEVMEHDISLAWTVPFWSDDVVNVPSSRFSFITALIQSPAPLSPPTYHL